MTITLVAGQTGGVSGAANAAVSKAFVSDVAVGDLIVVFAWRYNDTSATDFVAGDCTKSAGAATVGAITKDVSLAFKYSASFYIDAAVWSCQVTGAGPCTMQVAVGATSSQTTMGIAEFHTDSGGPIAFLAGTNKTGSGASGAPATASATSTAGSVFAGCVGTATSGSTTHTPGLTYSQVYEEEAGATKFTGSAEYKIVATPGGTSTADWQAPTTVPWVAALAVYQEVITNGVIVADSAHGHTAESPTLAPGSMPDIVTYQLFPKDRMRTGAMAL